MTTKKKTETKRPAQEPVKIKPLPWITKPVDYSTAALALAVKAGSLDDKALEAAHFLLGFCASVLLAAGRDCHPGAMVLPFGDTQKSKAVLAAHGMSCATPQDYADFENLENMGG